MRFNRIVLGNLYYVFYTDIRISCILILMCHFHLF